VDDFHSQDAGILTWLLNSFDLRFLSKLIYLSGKPFLYSTLEEALPVLGLEIDLPFDVPGGMPSYRKTLALSFLFKFWNAVSVGLNIPLNAEATMTSSPEDITGIIHRQPTSGRRDNSVSFTSFKLQMR
jgi:xanthine dehydrogenase/oxidase